MAADNQNFEMHQGDSKELYITVTDDEGKIVDLSGAVITWKLFKNYTSPALVSKSSDAGGGVNLYNPTGGQFVVVLQEPDTNSLYGQYLHEARVEDIRGYITVVTTGRVQIHQRHTL